MHKSRSLVVCFWLMDSSTGEECFELGYSRHNNQTILWTGLPFTWSCWL